MIRIQIIITYSKTSKVISVRGPKCDWATSYIALFTLA